MSRDFAEMGNKQQEKAGKVVFFSPLNLNIYVGSFSFFSFTGKT